MLLFHEETKTLNVRMKVKIFFVIEFVKQSETVFVVDSSMTVRKSRVCMCLCVRAIAKLRRNLGQVLIHGIESKSLSFVHLNHEKNHST